MFRDKKTSRGTTGSDREKRRSSSPKSRSSGDAGRVSSGRVEKAQVTKSAPDRTKLRQAAKGIKHDSNYTVRNKDTSKEQKQSVKTENSTAGKNENMSYRRQMIITPDPQRKCVDTEIDQIKEALVDALEPLEDGCYPQFYNCHNVKGLLVLTCANEQTKRWLERTVPQLQPWEGAKLRVKLRGEEDAQGPKVMFKTPKLFAKTDPKKILQMLSTQNKTLETNTWKNVSVKSEASGQTLVYAVDSRSVEAVRALNNKAYLGLGNIELVILNNEEDGKQTSENTQTKNDKGDKKEVSADTDTKNEEKSDKKTS